MPVKEIFNNPNSRWMDDDGPETGVIISSRVRVARNLKDLPFPHLLDQEKSENVVSTVTPAFQNEETFREDRFEFFRISELSPVERQILVDKHLISPDLLNKLEGKAVVLREDGVVSVMLNEEDHLRIQCLLPGLKLERAWEIVEKVDNGLEKTLDYAYSEKFGYLTACPTNTGTGMRASVMVHLCGLVLTRQLNNMLNAVHKLGLTVRGLYGEGTEALGDLFQISNQITLGQSEGEIIVNLNSIARQILAQERSARTVLFKEKKEMIMDRAWRAFGILKNARVMTSEEVMRLISDLRLGVDLGILPAMPLKLLNELMVMTRPAFLTQLAARDMEPHQRDIFRAELVRNGLSGLDGLAG